MYIIAALLIVASWGIHPAIIRIGLGEVPTFHLLALRFLFTGLLFLPFAKLQKKDVLNLFTIAIFFNVIHLGLIFWGLNYLTSASSSSIQQLQAPFSVLLAVFFLKERITLLQILGIFVAIAGVVVIRGVPELHTIGFILTILGSLAFSIVQINMKTMGKIDIATFTAYTSFFSLPFLVLLAYLFEDKVHWENVEYNRLTIVLAYQVFILGFSTAIWQKLTETKGVNKVIPFSLLTPVFAIIGGYIILSEIITSHILIGMGLTIIGVALTIFFKPKTN